MSYRDSLAETGDSADYESDTGRKRAFSEWLLWGYGSLGYARDDN